MTGSSTSHVTIGGGQFTGNLTGFLNLSITGQVALAGFSAIGSIQIGNGASFASLTNEPGGFIDLDTNSDISLASGASSAFFVNEGTVLRNGVAGSSVVSVPFLNSGTMRITTGSVTFTDRIQQFRRRRGSPHDEQRRQYHLEPESSGKRLQRR